MVVRCRRRPVFGLQTDLCTERQESPEGIEMQVAVSALSPHVILKGLAPRARGRFVLLNYVGSGNPGVLGDLNCEECFSPGFGQTRMNGQCVCVLFLFFRSWHETTMRISSDRVSLPPSNHTTVAAASEALVHFWSSPAGGSAHVLGLNPGLIESDSEKQPIGGVFKGAEFSRTKRFSLGSSPSEFAANIMPLLVSPQLEHPEMLFIGRNEPLAAAAAASDGVGISGSGAGGDGAAAASKPSGDAAGGGARRQKRSWNAALDELQVGGNGGGNSSSNKNNSNGSSASQRQRVAKAVPRPLLLNHAGCAIEATPEFLEPAYVQRWVAELDGLAVKAAENRARMLEALRVRQEQQEQMLHLDMFLLDEHAAAAHVSEYNAMCPEEVHVPGIPGVNAGAPTADAPGFHHHHNSSHSNGTPWGPPAPAHEMGVGSNTNEGNNSNNPRRNTGPLPHGSRVEHWPTEGTSSSSSSFSSSASLNRSLPPLTGGRNMPGTYPGSAPLPAPLGQEKWQALTGAVVLEEV